MEQPEPLARLPEAYQRALTLYREGADDAAIAAKLQIERQAVGPLLRIAQAKLKSLASPTDPSGRSESADERPRRAEILRSRHTVPAKDE